MKIVHRLEAIQIKKNEGAVLVPSCKPFSYRTTIEEIGERIGSGLQFEIRYRSGELSVLLSEGPPHGIEIGVERHSNIQKVLGPDHIQGRESLHPLVLQLMVSSKEKIVGPYIPARPDIVVYVSSPYHQRLSTDLHLVVTLKEGQNVSCDIQLMVGPLAGRTCPKDVRELIRCLNMLPDQVREPLSQHFISRSRSNRLPFGHRGRRAV